MEEERYKLIEQKFTEYGYTDFILIDNVSYEVASALKRLISNDSNFEYLHIKEMEEG